MNATIELEILNWEKFNKKDVFKTPFWFKLNINVGSSESLFGLSPVTKWVWVLLLAQAMKSRGAKFELNVQWAAKQWDLEVDVLKEAIFILKSRSLLQCDSESTRSALGADSEPTPLYSRIEKSRIEKNTTSVRNAEASSQEKVVSVLLDQKTNAILANVSVSVQKAWIDLYQDVSWIKEELLKIQIWLETNPNKKPKSNWARFISGWLGRGWEKHRQQLPKLRKLKEVTF